MAKLPEEIIDTVLNLQKQLLEQIDSATQTEYILLEQFGETEESLPELEELQTLKERTDAYYSRFYVTLRRIYESQPIASRDMLELLFRSIYEAELTIEAVQASIRDIKRNWSL